MRRWTEAEYDILFRHHPPNDSRAPDLGECRAIAKAVRRTTEAVLAQWHDARSVFLGNVNAASRPLIDYVAARRWN
jgi:hypothetical protein